MAFRFLEDVAIADVAFEVEAQSLSCLFKESALALLHIQLGNPDSLLKTVDAKISLSHQQPDMLLYLFLQELVYLKDVKRWLLKADQMRVGEDAMGFHLEAHMAGEAVDPSRHEQGADIKAITLHGLKVEPSSGGWKALVIVDI